MKFNLNKFIICLGALFYITSTFESDAFALLGPIQPWMQPTNGVIFPGDIGGPMDISNEYRWNVPMVTYGFDQSFINFFGSNGVAAVEGAIQFLNDLPAASSIVLTNYTFNTRRINPSAGARSLYDLKSATLSLLLEQMGLAEPARSTFVLKQWNPVFIYNGDQLSWPDGTISQYIVQKNYDPQTLNATNYVDNVSFTARVYDGGGQYGIELIAVDSFSPLNPAVADFDLNPGDLYIGLTYDDVGGLTYLLSTNNVNYETLLPGIAGTGANLNSYVNGALRPGVDKITFVRQPTDSQSGTFLSLTNYYTDNYITNGILKQQQLVRVVSQPDFLFSAGDVTPDHPAFSFYSRTGITNWLNNAVANGSTNGAGPGVIQPQVQIVFEKLGLGFLSGTSDEEVNEQSHSWASFDITPNAPVVYPAPQTGTNAMTVRMWLGFEGNYQQSFAWKPVSVPGALFAMQTSTNLNSWVTLFSVTNNGSICTYFNDNPSSAHRFYRLISE